MTSISDLGNAAWRDYVTDGDPSSGARRVPKSEVRAVMGAIDIQKAQVVDTLADFRALTSAPDAVLIKGKDAAVDGWGGVFVRVAGSVAPDDEALVLRRTAGGDSYKRLFNPVVMDSNGDASVTGILTVTNAIRSLNIFGSLEVRETLGGNGFRWAAANDATARLQKTTDGFSTASTPIYVGSDGKVGINDTLTPLARLQVTQADGSFSFGVSGTTKGIRFSHSAASSRIEGVDNTLGVSQQPLQIDGSIVQLATANTTRWYLDPATGGFFSGIDNAYSLGGSSNRASVVYAGTGTINTSGRDAKVGIVEPSEAERLWASLIKARGPMRYRFKDAVDARGDSARFHFGYIVEDILEDAATAGIVNPWSYGFLCSDPIVETETYFETATRPKMQTVEHVEDVVELHDGQPVLVRKTVEQAEPIGALVAVLDEEGQPVLRQLGANQDGSPIMAPLMHFVSEMEEYEEERTREVNTGEVRLGLRYSELEAFLRCAD